MQSLSYTENDEDIKFLVFCLFPLATFFKSSVLSLTIDGTCFITLDSIVEQLFKGFNEEFDTKRLAEFKKIRKSPLLPKKEFSTLNLLCYIKAVENMLVTGSLKNKDSLNAFALLLQDKKINFDHEFQMLEIRAGRISSIVNAEGLDKLYCENVVSNRDYFICSGLREHYKIENLQGNTYLFLLNIKKTKFKSLESEGMICCGKLEAPLGGGAISGGVSGGVSGAASADVSGGVSADVSGGVSGAAPADASGAAPGAAPASRKVEALQVACKEGERIYLQGHLRIFEDLEYAKVDIKKEAFQKILGEFRIKDHCLYFKESKVLIGNEEIKTEIPCGSVH